ncbi:MAG: hypothetical protein GYA55_01440 [SAR324 cluster bacterium]|uniref:Uncharacterized protein n=1 Tax=SAR324 cluster bacterium TaxID=2024889 RepID=A0A7X9IIP0_9DELT|nr:hypothetical protein [SAR324 cluster bacterium]
MKYFLSIPKEAAERRRFLLGGLCLFAFIVLVVLLILGMTSSEIAYSKKGPSFASYGINKNGAHIRIAHDSNLNPIVGEDFILMSWFKFFRLPKEKETFLLLSKVDSQLRSQRGYRLGITREHGRLRPFIYWRNSESQGGAYKFSDLNLTPRVWVMFGISFSNQRYLGLHAVIKAAGKKPEVMKLGGYELSVPVFPDSSADVFVGSFGGTPYRGLLGPLSIVSFKERKESLYRIFKTAAQEGESIKSIFGDEQIKLLIEDARSDSSKFGHLITISSDIEKGQEGSGILSEVEGVEKKTKHKKKESRVQATPTVTATVTASPNNAVKTDVEVKAKTFQSKSKVSKGLKKIPVKSSTPKKQSPKKNIKGKKKNE